MKRLPGTIKILQKISAIATENNKPMKNLVCSIKPTLSKLNMSRFQQKGRIHIALFIAL